MTSCCSEYRENTARQKEIAGSSDCGRGNRLSALAVEVDAATTRRMPHHRPNHFITTPRGNQTPALPLVRGTKAVAGCQHSKPDFGPRPGRPGSVLAARTVEAAASPEDAAPDRAAAGAAGLARAIVDTEGALELASV